MMSIVSAIVSPTAFWVLLLIVFVIWAVLSWVLWYHWHSYSKGSHGAKKALRIYFSISALLIIVAILLILGTF